MEKLVESEKSEGMVRMMDLDRSDEPPWKRSEATKVHAIRSVVNDFALWIIIQKLFWLDPGDEKLELGSRRRDHCSEISSGESR